MSQFLEPHSPPVLWGRGGISFGSFRLKRKGADDAEQWKTHSNLPRVLRALLAWPSCSVSAGPALLHSDGAQSTAWREGVGRWSIALV